MIRFSALLLINNPLRIRVHIVILKYKSTVIVRINVASPYLIVHMPNAALYKKTGALLRVSRPRSGWFIIIPANVHSIVSQKK